VRARSPESCPACSAAAEPRQEYCLECGSRLVPRRRLDAAERAWERRLGRYPGDWVWFSALLLLVAAGSAAAGIVTSGDGRAVGGETVVATSRVVTLPPVAPVATLPVPPATVAPAPPPAPAPPGAAAPADALRTWPARDGYTVVLSSIPARGSGLADARARAKEALARGVRDVGILDSSRFASLHPGYYVVFAGVYGSLEEAQTAVGRVAARFPNAYARQIVR
jgi:hypothetical protein